MKVGKGKMCVGELIHLVLSSLCRHIDFCWDVHHALWPSIIFLVDNLRDILCSCQNGLLRSGALSLFMVGNNFVVSRLHQGKRNGYFALSKILTTAHSPISGFYPLTTISLLPRPEFLSLEKFQSIKLHSSKLGLCPGLLSISL